MFNTFILMVKKVFKDLDKKALKIMKRGLIFCISIGVVSVFILFTYEFIFSFPTIYNIGLTLFRASIIFATQFIICAIAVDKIKKQLI